MRIDDLVSVLDRGGDKDGGSEHAYELTVNSMAVYATVATAETFATMAEAQEAAATLYGELVGAASGSQVIRCEVGITTDMESLDYDTLVGGRYRGRVVVGFKRG